MRSFIVMAMFVASLTHAAMNGYTETRYLELDTDDIEVLSIDAGAGSMDIKGIAGASAISVKAVIEISDTNVDEAMKIIERNMTLSLEQKGTVAHLKAWFEHGFLNFGSDDGRIDIEVKVPQGIAVIIDDGSGSIDVVDLMADISIDDGSGSIDVSNVAHVKIDDGSGSIDVSHVSGDVSIIDGSGSINVRGVQGSVTIDDGSGSIKISDVEEDLIITGDGSGGLTYSDIRGTVQEDT
ncbi:MAG: hypothetical protein IIB74_00050 [Proteobacteria bacterium]|nr:hypothetical protein [Pseudomonadota bacterium]